MLIEELLMMDFFVDRFANEGQVQYAKDEHFEDQFDHPA